MSENAAAAEGLVEGRTIAVLGGTGPQGRGLARRFAAAGLEVVIGSRSAERAESTAAELADAVERTFSVPESPSRAA